LRVAWPAMDSRRFYSKYGMEEVDIPLVKRIDE
jgi:hypothetical protein